MNRRLKRSALNALEFSKECYFQKLEHGTESMSEHEQASARCFEELLHAPLSEIEIGAVCASRGCTYPKEA